MQTIAQHNPPKRLEHYQSVNRVKNYLLSITGRSLFVQTTAQHKQTTRQLGLSTHLLSLVSKIT